ncbi:MAG: hypothetical protein AB7V58_02130 [Solirubrobacterales bacterium]
MSDPQPPQPPLEEAERERIAALAAVVIPGGSGMPSAAEAEASGAALDLVLAARPDLLPELRRAAALPGEPAAALAQLERSDPEALEGLALALSCAYVQSDPVRDSLGYPGQVPVPPPAAPDPLDELLAPVRARGPRYVPTPPPAG